MIYNRIVKRLLDIVLSVVLLVVLSPIFVVIVVVLYVFQGNPVIFGQVRLGWKGKKFKIYKFRTMKVDAEELKSQFTEQEKEEYEQNLKLKHDKRVTVLGRILRRTSLDELPQLWNILKGDMSFTGPRPIVEVELEKYAGQKEKFLSLKPGLIGYWQAYCKPSTTYSERVEMELYYIENESFWFDIRIFFKSIATVIRKAIVAI